MASTAAAAAAASAMAAQVASLSLGSSPSTSLTSSFTGTLVPLRRHVVVPSLRARNLTVQAKGGFIPAQHRWMYEGVEKMGPVRISPLSLLPCVSNFQCSMQKSLSPTGSCFHFHLSFPIASECAFFAGFSTGNGNRCLSVRVCEDNCNREPLLLIFL